jgi:hypothetical protein
MKFNGNSISGTSEEVLVVPWNNTNLVFRARAILDTTEYEKLYPVPTPPTVRKPGGIVESDRTDKSYLEAIDKWAERKSHWYYVNSLVLPDGMEWETVDSNDPDTWENWIKELNTFLPEATVARVAGLVMIVNGLDQKRIDEQTKLFLAGRLDQQATESSQPTEPNSTQNTEPAKD